MHVTTALPVRKACNEGAFARQPKSIWKEVTHMKTLQHR
jgi:hypothetical protein